MRLIDADALKEKKVYSLERHEKIVPVAEIDWMPTIDAVPVVRCKDCKHRFDGCCYSRKSNQISFGAYVAYDWFCAYGERKEGR